MRPAAAKVLVVGATVADKLFGPGADPVGKTVRIRAVPFLVVGTAGTVNTGAIDPLAEIADIASRENLWFHVDGAIGALAMLSGSLRDLFKGIEKSASVALDFHKWGQVPYDAGFLLVRDGDAQKCAFAQPAAYLQRADRGLAARPSSSSP